MVVCVLSSESVFLPSFFCVKPSHRLLLYGSYCSQVEAATKHLDKLSSQREDIRMKLEVRLSETGALVNTALYNHGFFTPPSQRVCVSIFTAIIKLLTISM